MRSSLRALGFSALLAAVACGGGGEVKWTSVAAEDGSFKAELPGKVERVSSSLSTPVGPAPIEMWVFQDGERAYMVGFTEYPEKVRAAVEDRELLESARDGAVARVRGKLLIDEPKQAGGLPGRRIELDAEEGQVRVRGEFYVSGRRLYQVFATVHPQEIESAEVQRFFESFVLLPRVAASGTTVELGEPTPRAVPPQDPPAGR